MKRIYKLVFLGLLVFGSVLLGGCKKFLDKPADAALQTPHTVADFQSIMDETTITTNATPGLGPLYVNDYYYSPPPSSPPSSAGLDSFSYGAYTWQPVLMESSILQSWSHPYAAIYDCNTVLTGLPMLSGLDSADQAASRFVLGQAYFIRAFMFFHLEETFGQPYRPATVSTDLGVPLRISENVMPKVPRATVLAVYVQIVSDLEHAVALLPAALQVSNRNRACRSAAYGLLARVWLTRQDYVKASAYADSSLGLYNTLIDYNTVDSTAAHPFPIGGNNEVLFQCSADNYTLQFARSTIVDSTLYSSYDRNDLRRVIFFQRVSPAPSMTVPTGMTGPAFYPGFSFKGQYTGLFYLFSGLAVDEIYLIRAEARAWNGDAAGAVADVNTLLSKRWRRGTFVPYVAGSSSAALQLVLTEKRKETVFREGRFYDLRRLNQFPAYADTLSRVYGGHVYTLLPGDVRYALPIPPQEIALGGVVQNPE